MGNGPSYSTASGVSENLPRFIKRDESFGSKSPRRVHNDHHSRTNTRFGSEGVVTGKDRCRSYRSQSLEQSGNGTGTHSPSSSRSSSGYSGNFYIHNLATNDSALADKNCLRQCPQPMFQISGDLNPHQINLVRRNWKQVMKSMNNDETELATRLLLRIFQLDPKNQIHFSLGGIPFSELRDNPVFISHVKAFEPTLSHVMNHLTNATSLSKHLQQLGGRHVNYTGITYKSPYWKQFVQALVEAIGANHGTSEVHEAFNVLGEFCAEQMRIGYRIEWKLQMEAERLAKAHRKKHNKESNVTATANKKLLTEY